MVAKKNFTLKTLVQEKEAAQHDLQQAHDQLEARVKERTAQLKVEMTVRKESELQFRAVLTERTRLAQELHDTLEQSLTGIAVQQDLVANQLGKNTDRATQHLKLARNLMRQSQVDLRRSVWGLRSRSEEEFNLASALLTSVRQMTDDTGIHVEVETVGEAGFLSEIAEENLLRIGQEAMTNAVKHSGAQMIKFLLQYGPQAVVLQIEDNGTGFDLETCAGPKNGHFGLLGIRESGPERLGSPRFKSTAYRAKAQPSAFKFRVSRQMKINFCSPTARTMKKEVKTRILVADDHYVVRMGVISIINDEPDLEVVAEAANGIQAVELFNKHKPDVVLLDSRMPLKNGVQAAMEIRHQHAAARILMLTAFDGDEDIHKAFAAGASARLCFEKCHRRTTRPGPARRGGREELDTPRSGRPPRQAQSV